MIYMGSSSSLIDEFRVCMKKEIEMTDLGLLNYFLGIEVKQVEAGVFISQRKYAMDLLKRFCVMWLELGILAYGIIMYHLFN